MNTKPLVDCEAPDFELRTESGDLWRLSDHRGSVIALLFYPQNETLVCNRQLCSVRDSWRDYVASSATIIGISPESESGHAEFRSKYELPFTILADAGRSVTSRYCGHSIFPLSFMRGVVVIDAKGIVRSRRTMLRVFRPSDASVISSIYSARVDKANDEFDRVASRREHGR